MAFLLLLLITILVAAQFYPTFWRLLCLIILPRIIGFLYYLVFVPLRKFFLSYNPKYTSFVVLVSFSPEVQENILSIIQFLWRRLFIIQPSIMGVQCLNIIHNYFNKIPMSKLKLKDVFIAFVWNLFLFKCFGFSTLFFLLIRLVIESLLQDDLPTLCYFLNNFSKISPGCALMPENKPILSLYLDTDNTLTFSTKPTKV